MIIIVFVIVVATGGARDTYGHHGIAAVPVKPRGSARFVEIARASEVHDAPRTAPGTIR